MVISGMLHRYWNALACLPPTGQGYHHGIMKPAILGVRLELDDNRIFTDIRAHTREEARRVPDSEIRQAIESAHRYCESDQATDGNQPSIEVPNQIPLLSPSKADKLKAFYIQQGKSFTNQDIIAKSVVALTGDPKEDLLIMLDTLYSDDEYLFFGNQYMTDTVFPVCTWKQFIREDGVSELPHFIPNPLTGQEHLTQDGKLSKRCDAAVQSYRFAIGEFDNMDKVDQIAFWLCVPLPVAALIDSGNKSIHALIKLPEGYTQPDWGTRVKGELFNLLGTFSCDIACSNPSRLSRTPGHQRENGNYQKLIYLNPKPTKEGIAMDIINFESEVV